QYLAELVVVFLKQRLVAEHQASALGSRYFFPAFIGFGGGCNRRFHLIGCSVRYLSQHVLRGRVRHVDEIATARLLPLATDQVGQIRALLIACHLLLQRGFGSHMLFPCRGQYVVYMRCDEPTSS